MAVLPICDHLFALDSCHGRLVAAAIGVDPRARIGRTVGTPLSFVIGWRTLFSAPYRQSFVIHFIGVLKRFACVAEPVRLDVFARLFSSEWQFVSDDLDACNVTSAVYKINMLHQEKATLHPLELHLPLDVWPRYVPCAD